MRANDDGWTTTGANILAPEQRDAIRRALEVSRLIVEDRHYRGARAPDVLVFDELESFDAYVRDHTRPGDAIWCWSFALCRDDNDVAHGNVPDLESRADRRRVLAPLAT